MKPILVLAVTSWFLALAASAAVEPFMVETRVQADLETAISKIIKPEQFLIQVSGEVTTQTERKIQEGETLSADVRERRNKIAPVPPMPGFVPELETTEEESTDRLPQQNRQSYRMVETPVLTAIRVRASFDQKLATTVIARAKEMITSYLTANYPNKAFVAFASVPMLGPEKSPAELERLAALQAEKKEKTAKEIAEEQFWVQAKWAMWTGLALLALIFLNRGSRRNSEGKSIGGYQPPSPMINFGALGESLGLGRQGSGAPASAPSASPAQIASAYQRRKKLLDKVMSRSEAFRLYYERLSNEERDELYIALKGPAYESLLDGLGQRRPVTTEELDSNTLEERITVHEKNFDEFVQAKDWQERQFFGFLGQMSQDQLQALCNHQPPRVMCLMLRFMKPHQSAAILDKLPQIRRREVLSYSKEIAELPLSDLIGIEKDIRASAGRLPQQLMSTEKEDAAYWGSVLGESTQQEALFDDMEKTNPGLSPGLKKFKFRLEDAATLPDNLLAKVLGKVDNEELCLALATCQPEVVDVILDALGEMRRELITKQMPSYRSAGEALATQARQTLTRRFREVLA